MKTQGINRNRQKENNIRQIIRLLYRTESCSRVSIANSMNLTQAAITKLVNPLIERGLVEEVQQINTASGRKPVQLKLAADRFSIISARINRDYVSAALNDLCGAQQCCETLQTNPHSSPEDAFASFVSIVGHMIAKAKSKVLGIGIAVPGPFNMYSNTVTLMSGFSGWNRIDIKGRLEKEFGLPVFLEQDANCGAMAELWCGNRNCENFVYVTADRGVGSGIVIDGQIYRGDVGYAGEFGHMSIRFDGPVCECGNHGCLEMYCSTNALEKRYCDKTGSRLSSSRIFELVREGDSAAKEVYAETINYLSFGCASLINILNPEAVIFADKITEGGDFFLSEVRSSLKRFLMPELSGKIRVDISRFEIDPTMIGAGVLVLDRMLEEGPEVLTSAR